jgi:hypothetical protein
MGSWLPTQVRDSDSNESGSLAPLGIGLAMLSLTLVLAILAAGSLYLTERRLTTVAESTAIAVLIDAKGNLAQPLESNGFKVACKTAASRFIPS